MKPRERFSIWCSWLCWSLAISVDFRFTRAAVMLGPVGFEFYWGNL